jgi:hypothetical protein
VRIPVDLRERIDEARKEEMPQIGLRSYAKIGEVVEAALTKAFPPIATQARRKR